MKTLPLFAFILITVQVAAQNYQSYYEGCNSADSLAYLGQYEQALHTLETAFESVDVVHAQQYMDAYHLAIKLDRFDKAVEYGKRAIINSGNEHIIRTKASKDFRKSNDYSSIKDSCEYFIEQFNGRVNQHFRKQIDSLYYVDQRIIRKNHSVKGKYKINK